MARGTLLLQGVPLNDTRRKQGFSVIAATNHFILAYQRMKGWQRGMNASSVTSEM
jgi:hypothetical protein